MKDIISKTAIKLSTITNADNIDWDAFRGILLDLDDINVYSENFNETILTEFIQNAYFYHRGEIMPEAIRHFIDCGYDVTANNGKNGGLALEALCWSSYDEHILDAAKVLMNVGAPVNNYTLTDDGEARGLLEALGFKLPGAWAVDKDFHYANVLEAYYAVAEANLAGKDFNSILCYSDCVGLKINSVYASECNSNSPEDVFCFDNALVINFEDKPLVIRPYIDFVVNTPYFDKNKNDLLDNSKSFEKIIGATLKKIQYVSSTICCFEFDNGYRLIFSSKETDDEKVMGYCRITPISEAPSVDELDIDFICGESGITYSSKVTEYEENSLALFCGEKVYILYTIPNDEDKNQIKLFECPTDLTFRYNRKYPVDKPHKISCFYENEGLTSMCFDYGDRFMYFTTEYHNHINVRLSSEQYDLSDCLYMMNINGIHMEFEKRTV